MYSWTYSIATPPLSILHSVLFIISFLLGIFIESPTWRLARLSCSSITPSSAAEGEKKTMLSAKRRYVNFLSPTTIPLSWQDGFISWKTSSSVALLDASLNGKYWSGGREFYGYCAIAMYCDRQSKGHSGIQLVQEVDGGLMFLICSFQGF